MFFSSFCLTELWRLYCQGGQVGSCVRAQLQPSQYFSRHFFGLYFDTIVEQQSVQRFDLGLVSFNLRVAVNEACQHNISFRKTFLSRCYGTRQQVSQFSLKSLPGMSSSYPSYWVIHSRSRAFSNPVWAIFELASICIRQGADWLTMKPTVPQSAWRSDSEQQ